MYNEKSSVMEIHINLILGCKLPVAWQGSKGVALCFSLSSTEHASQ